MKKLYTLFFTVLFLTSTKFVSAQVTIAQHDFETTLGSPVLNINTGTPTYYTGSSAAGDVPSSSPFYTSSNRGWGVNNGTSTVTFNNQSLSGYTNCFVEFRLASFALSPGTGGADGPDKITLSISTDAGTTWSSELTVAGNNQARWSYTTGTGNATATYDGNNTPTAFAPAAGGNRTTDGYSTIHLDIPVTYSQVMVRINILNDQNQELWTIDDLKIRGTSFTCTAPTTASSGLSFASITTSSTTLNWSTNGNGANRIVVAKQNALVSGAPTNGTAYTANSVFGSGSTIAANEYVVYNGSGSSAPVSSLTAGAAYNFKIFEYNCSGGNEAYYLTTPSASMVTLPNTPLAFTAGCGSDTTITLTWTTPAGFSDGFLVFANSATNTYTPSGAGTGYTGANSIYTSATSYGGEKLVYSGTGNIVTVTGLTAGTTYYFRTFSYVSSTYSAASSVSSSYAGVQPVTGASATSGNGILTLNWTNPASCWDSVMIIATDNATLTYTPAGDGSAYFDNAFYSDPPSEISGSNVYCVYKGTTSSMVLFGLTNTVLYRMRIYVRDGSNWSNGVLISGTPNVATGDFQSVTSGNWKNNNTWQIWNGTAWVATTLNTQWPNTPTASATVLSGHTVTVNGNGPYSILNLTIQSGGKVYCNTNDSIPVYLSVFQQINCDGTFGNGAIQDDLSVNAEGDGVSGCAIGGSGTCAISRIRKKLGTNTTTKLLINMDVDLTYTGASQTVLYNDHAATFNVFIGAGKTVNTPAGGNISIDGLAGADPTKSLGVIDVSGTLNVDGIYYMTTNNNNGPVGLTIENGGIVNVNSIDASASLHPNGHTLLVKNGGLLNIYGTSAFLSFSNTYNAYTCNTGSTVNYSAAGAQTIESGINYADLTGSGSGNKTPNGNLTVNGSLTIDAAIFNVNTSLKTISLQSDLTLQNGGTMSDNCKTLFSINAINTSSDQLFTGNGQLIKCFDFYSTKFAGKVELIGASGNSDLYIRNSLKIDFTSLAKLIDNGNTFNVGNDAELGSATSTASNFQLTGTLKFICVGAAAATDIHLSNYAGTGMTVANIYNLGVDAEAGSLVNQVQIFPAAGGQTLTINGNVSIQNTNALSDLLNPNNNTLTLKGNWSDYAATGFTEGTGQVILSGTAAQNIAGAESFYKLEINNSNGVTINSNTIVSNELKLTNGVITTGANELQVTSNSVASVTGYSVASYVAGNLRRTVASTGIYDFPVGNSNYQLATVKLNSSTGMSTILAFFNTTITGAAPSYPTTQINGTGIYGILNSGFWTITPDAYTAVNYDITLNQRGYSNFAGNANQLGVIKRTNSGANWVGTNLSGSNGFHSNATQSISGGTAIAKRTSVTAFSDFAEGFGGSALPVTLSSFSLNVIDNKSVELNWRTEAEINCDYYSIERSEDGISFNSIGKILGNGTSDQPHNYQFTDYKPYCAESYYRLHQFDISTEEHLSNILSANIVCNGISVSPNPVLNNLNFKLLYPSVTPLKIIVTNIDGRIVINNELNFIGNNFTIDITSLPAGLYFINLTNGIESFNSRFIKQ